MKQRRKRRWRSRTRRMRRRRREAVYRKDRGVDRGVLGLNLEG